MEDQTAGKQEICKICSSLHVGNISELVKNSFLKKKLLICNSGYISLSRWRAGLWLKFMGKKKNKGSYFSRDRTF